MDDALCRQFFTQPSHSLHRRYEILRTYFLEGRSLEDVAEQFGMNFYTVREWAREFRTQRQAGLAPPFLPSHYHEADRAALRLRPRLDPKMRRSPIAGN